MCSCLDSDLGAMRMALSKVYSSEVEMRKISEWDWTVTGGIGLGSHENGVEQGV